MNKLDLTNFSKTLDSFQPSVKTYDEGKIIQLGDGICRLEGLNSAMANEILLFPNNVFGLAFNLEKNSVGAIIVGDDKLLKEGDPVRTSGKILQIPVGPQLLGRVVNPLGQSLDGKPLPLFKKAYTLEKIAPGVILRQPVDTPLQTGIKAIDAVTPIGRGQRELIIGDRGIGKTALAIDTIINQKEENVICIYVAIGQKITRVAKVVDKLKQFGALDYTIVVSATSADPASLQYLAPYAGCAIAEYFMDQKKDVLVVYDDLTKHAWAYRQLSLLLRRPSGREAYPGDIFYLHSRLLERSCRMADKYGGGSITALPIIETQAGDVSAFIPTNVISITDGQIYLEPELFYSGIRPALNPGLSVSRVGGAAQVKGMKKVAGKIRLELSQYRELASFAQFTTDLDPATKQKIDRGSRIVEILKQPENQPLPVAQQIVILWAAINGYLDKIPLKNIPAFETALYEELINQKSLLKQINKIKDLDQKIEAELKKIISKLSQKFMLEENKDAQQPVNQK